jgi:hypothetical protein
MLTLVALPFLHKLDGWAWEGPQGGRGRRGAGHVTCNGVILHTQARSGFRGCSCRALTWQVHRGLRISSIPFCRPQVAVVLTIKVVKNEV